MRDEAGLVHALLTPQSPDNTPGTLGQTAHPRYLGKLLTLSVRTHTLKTQTDV